MSWVGLATAVVGGIASAGQADDAQGLKAGEAATKSKLKIGGNKGILGGQQGQPSPYQQPSFGSIPKLSTMLMGGGQPQSFNPMRSGNPLEGMSPAMGSGGFAKRPDHPGQSTQGGKMG